MAILLVEDEILISMLVEETLSDAGYMVLSATSADEAMKILEARDDVQLILTDIDMPGSMDGLELAAMVNRRWPPISIVVASGKHRPVAAEMPPDSVFLPKPYLPGDIVRVIRTFH